MDDDELIARELHIQGRPDTDPSLSKEKPTPEDKIKFRRDYAITPPADLPERRDAVPYVWCAFCQKPTHWIGWEAEDQETGRRFLVGRNCAAQHGADVIKRAANAFAADVARQQALVDRRDLLASGPELVTEITHITQLPGIAAVGQWRRLISSWSRGTLRELQTTAQAPIPNLLVHQSTRDPVSGGMRREPVIFARIPFPRLYTGLDPKPVCEGLAAKARDALRVLQRESRLTTTAHLQQAIRTLLTSAEDARRINAEFAGVADGLSDQAIDDLLKWGRTPGGGGLGERFRRNRRIEWTGSFGTKHGATIPEVV